MLLRLPDRLPPPQFEEASPASYQIGTAKTGFSPELKRQHPKGNKRQSKQPVNKRLRGKGLRSISKVHLRWGLISFRLEVCQFLSRLFA